MAKSARQFREAPGGMKVERLNLLGKVKGIISNLEFYKKPSCRGNWSMLP